MKTVWILNHYATGMMQQHGGRHYNFAKYLIKAGYNVRIFGASTLHNKDQNLLSPDQQVREEICDGIPFVILYTRSYTGNGKTRILNMIDYYRAVLKVADRFERPDVIIGSSVHPLACLAAIKLSKRFHCRSIVEIRDLWPETIIAYNIRKASSPIIRILYKLEKWLYTHADAVVFTMPGGSTYIEDKKWDRAHGGSIDLNKIYNINNGVDLPQFEYNVEQNAVVDEDLQNPNIFKVVYTGSLRMVNHVDNLVQVAAELKKKQADRIKILVWGAGDQKEKLEEMIREEKLNNIVLKGIVNKKNVPSILVQSDLNIFFMRASVLMKYGLSLNKMFEYFASGKPVLTNFTSGFSIIDQYQCGVCTGTDEPQVIADEIIRFSNMSQEEYAKYEGNARCAAKEFDLSALTDKLIQVIETVSAKEK